MKAIKMKETNWILERLGPVKEKVYINLTVFTIGRQKENNLCCPSLEVSRSHGMLTITEDGPSIVDLGSSNGIFVNGFQIIAKQPHFLRLGDIIGFGCSIKDTFETSLTNQNFVYILKTQEPEAEVTSSASSEIKRLSTKQLSKLRITDDNIIVKKPKTEPIDIDLNDNDECQIIEPQLFTSKEKEIINQKKNILQTIEPDIIDITDDLDLIDENVKATKSNENCDKIKKERMEVDEILPDNSHLMTDFIKKEPLNDEVDNQDKKIKSEPDFTLEDIVDLEDDDDMFPASQLFDKSIKKEDDNENVCSITFLDDDDPNDIIILDSDEEVGIDFNPEPTAEPIDPLQIDNAVDELDNQNNPNHDFYLNKIKDIESEIEKKVKTLEQENKELLLNGIVNNKKVNHDSTEKPSSSKDRTKDSKKSTSKKKSKANEKTIEVIEPHHIKVKKKSKDSEKSPESKSRKKKKSKKIMDKHSHDSKEKSNSENLINNVNSESKDQKIDQDKTNEHTKCLGPMGKFSLSSEIESMRPRCKTTQVKAKVSHKSRNDLLCETMQTLRPIPKHKKLDNKIKKTDLPTSHSLPVPYIIPRRNVNSSAVKTPITNIINTNTTNDTNTNITNNANNENTINNSNYSTMPTNNMSVSSASTDNMNFYGTRSEVPDSTVEDIAPSVLSNATNNLNLSPYSDSNDSHDRSTPPLQAQENLNYECPQPGPSLKSLLTFPSLSRKEKNKKVVSFKENISTIREFAIEDGNKLKNIKDGLSLRSTKKDFPSLNNLTVEDFLSKVFTWVPVWLEQQQRVKTLPPIVKMEDMKQLPNTFKSFKEYYKNMEVLLLLETWQYFVKEYECNGTRYNQSIALPCTIGRNFKQMFTPNGLRYSIIQVQCMVSNKQFKNQNPPVYGDIIILEYTIKPEQNQKGKMNRAFAYVTQVHRQNAARSQRGGHPLCKYVTNPEILLTFYVQTRVIDEQTIQSGQIARLRSLFYLRPHLRLIQGLQYVPHSGLRDLILKVNVDEFQLENVPYDKILAYRKNLVTQENLNDKQTEAIIKFTTASVRLVPKIGLLIGPPGTGKSKVIANLVTEILYGDGRYVSGKPLRILVCAPSNAAIDEIVLRLLDIRSRIEKDKRFKMVRIGRVESMHEIVKKISVGELAQREAQKTYAEVYLKTTEAKEQEKHKIKKDIDALEKLLYNNPSNKVYEKNLEALKRLLKEKSQHSGRTPEQEEQELNKLRNSAKAVLIQKADVIACTLSSCYTGQMESIFGGNSNEKIATCIVDEATQCCEAETLIPLMLGVKSLILVGDPNQLPATVMSTEAKNLGLDRSLFTRTKEALAPQYNNERDDCKDPVITLLEQYRMVSSISCWPNEFFYKGQLMDRAPYIKEFPFQPYIVFNLNGLQDDIKFQNTSEAAFITNLITCLMTCSNLKTWPKQITIGIITPYQNQKSVIINAIEEKTRHISKQIKDKFVTEVNTIDSFQGQERDVIILSCVRSSGIGFMSDPQRLCVALTRAKFSLIICGNLSTFQRDEMWKNLLKNATGRGVTIRLPNDAKVNDIKQYVIRSGFCK